MYDSIQVTYLHFRHWEENESFFFELKKHLVDFGCPDYLSYLEMLEGYTRWKGKEDSGRLMGRSMLRNY